MKLIFKNTTKMTNFGNCVRGVEVYISHCWYIVETKTCENLKLTSNSTINIRKNECRHVQTHVEVECYRRLFLKITIFVPLK